MIETFLFLQKSLHAVDPFFELYILKETIKRWLKSGEKVALKWPEQVCSLKVQYFTAADKRPLRVIGIAVRQYWTDEHIYGPRRYWDPIRPTLITAADAASLRLIGDV